jgi:hypothetical protein
LLSLELEYSKLPVKFPAKSYNDIHDKDENNKSDKANKAFANKIS